MSLSRRILLLAIVALAAPFGSVVSRAQWTMVGQFQSPISVIQFMDKLGDAQLGFVGLSDGELWKTGDGGATWIQILVPGCNTAITSLTFKTPAEGWLSTRQSFPNSSVYHTTDFGVTWTPLSPATERPGVYYNDSTHLLFATSLVTNSLVSSDDGATWLPLQMTHANGISFSDGSFGVMSNYRGASASATRDGGKTWYPVTNGAECWMPLAIQGVEVAYCVSEVSSQVFRSTDYGLNWQTMSIVPAKCTGDIEGYCAQLYVQTDRGFYVSQDEGATWVAIGGPSNPLSDVRFALVGYTLYGGDDHGQLWRLNDGSRPFIGRLGFTVSVPYSLPTTVLYSNGCSPIDATLRIGANSGCLKTYLLSESDSVPPNAHASSLALFPHLLDPFNTDTIHIHYVPLGKGTDTLRFHCEYSVGGAIFDTTLLVYAISAPVLQVTPSTTNLRLSAPFNCTVVKALATMTNGKCDSLELDSVSVGDPQHFAVVSPTSIVKVPPKGVLSISLSGHGDTTGIYTTVATLYFRVGDSVFHYLLPVTLTVNQNGAVETSITPTSLSFGSTSICGKRDAAFYISNPSCAGYSIDSVYWIVHPSGFSVVRTPVLPRLLLSNDVDSVVLRFSPLVAGNTSGSFGVRLLVDGVHHDTVIRFSGLGFSQSKATLSVSDVRFDTMFVCDRTDTTVYIRNESCDSTEIVSVTPSSDTGFLLLNSLTPLWLAAGDSVPVHILLEGGPGSHHDSIEVWLQNKGGSQQVLDLPMTAYLRPSVRHVEVSLTTISQPALFPCSSHDTSLTIYNRGTCDTIQINALNFSGTTWFTSNTAANLPAILMPGDSLQIGIHTTAAPTGSVASSMQIIGKGFDTTIALDAAVAAYQGPALTVVSKDSIITARICHVASGRVVYQNRTCGPVTIDSLFLATSVNPSTQFFTGPISLPATVLPGDTISFNILFDASGSGNDSVRLNLVASGGITSETALITGLAIGSPVRAGLALLSASGSTIITAVPGDTVPIVLQMRDEVSDTLGLNEIEAHLAFNKDIVTVVTGASKANGGWKIKQETDGAGFVDLDLERQSTPTIVAGEELARIQFVTTLSDTLTTPVVASNILFNGGDSLYRTCTLQSKPSVDTLLVSIPLSCGDSLLISIMKGKVLIDQLEIQPNPSLSPGTPQALFRLNGVTAVTVEVLDVSGKLISSTTSQALGVGAHALPLSAEGLQSGVYFARLRANGESHIQKFVVQ